MDLKALQTTLRAFAAERDWERFHTPKNLVMALMVEAAELMEIFQWLTPEQSRQAPADPALQGRIAEEAADVLLYLLQLADHASVDLEQAVADKLVKNTKKHPPIAVAVAPEPTPGPAAPKQVQTHVLVDWENVQPKEADIRALAPGVSDVWIFHGPHQKRLSIDQSSFGNQVTLVPISRAGNNALDFHLSFYMGYIASRNPEARFVVISNDRGYGPMLEHATELGFAASQVGFALRKAPARKAVPKRAVPPQAEARKSAAAKKPAPTAVKAAPPKAAKPPKPAAAQKAPKPSVAKKATPAAKAPLAGKTTKTSAPAKKAAAAKAPAAKSTAVKQTPLVSATASAQEAEKAYAHVVASLRKSKTKPTRKARLYGVVKSLLHGGKAEAAEVERVVNRLRAEGYLEIDDKGAVVMKR